MSRSGRFTPWKEPQYPLNTWLGEPHSQYGPFGEEKNVVTLPGLESRIVQVAVLTKAFHTYGLHLLLLLLLLLLLSSSSAAAATAA